MTVARNVAKVGAGVVLGSALTLATTITASFEGLRLWAYKDPIGVVTICYGETDGVRMGDYYTAAECRVMLQKKVSEYMLAVDAMVLPPIPDTRLAALTSFAYNVGITNFANSTLLKKLNRGDVVGACNELSRWTFAKGKQLPGLVNRRAAERELCLKGV